MTKYDLGILKRFTGSQSEDAKEQSRLALTKLYTEGCTSEMQYRTVLSIAYQCLYNKYPKFLLG